MKFYLSICLALLTSLVLGVVARGAGNPGNNKKSKKIKLSCICGSIVFEQYN